MRARIILTGLITIAAACSRPADDPAIDPVSDEPAAAHDLALTSPTDVVPVASDLEMNRPEPAPIPEEHVHTPEPANVPEPMPEPIGAAIDEAVAAAPAPVAVATSHVHPKAADPQDAVAVSTEPGEPASGPSVEGGGKPTGISTGLGPVPDRNWGDPTIMDDPYPLPGMIGRAGAVIIRGGVGGVDDDCAKHPRGGAMAGGMGAGGPSVLVNDRDPRRGALINERAPRTSRRPSLPRGGGFPRGGIR